MTPRNWLNLYYDGMASAKRWSMKLTIHGANLSTKYSLLDVKSVLLGQIEYAVFTYRFLGNIFLSFLK